MLIQAAIPAVKVPTCPMDGATQVWVCTHGTSLLPLIEKPSQPVKQAAFSVYNRPWNAPSGTWEAVAKGGSKTFSSSKEGPHDAGRREGGER